MVSFSARTLILSSIALLSACQVAGRKRDAAKVDPVIGLFRYERLATNSTTLSTCNSVFSGWGSIVSPTSSAVSVATPTLGCRLATDDAIPLQRQRALDIGDLKISSEDEQRSGTLTRDPAYNFEFFATGLLLTAGHYFIQNLTPPSGIEFKKAFKVTNPASAFRVDAGDVYVGQALGTPVIVNPSDEGGTARARRDADFVIHYDLPLGTNFVRAQIVSDVTAEDSPSIVCYGDSSQSSLTMTQAFMAQLAPSENATLVMDFYTTEIYTDVAKMQELVIRTSQKHVHGRYGVAVPTSATACGESGLGDFGQLIIE